VLVVSYAVVSQFLGDVDVDIKPMSPKFVGKGARVVEYILQRRVGIRKTCDADRRSVAELPIRSSTRRSRRLLRKMSFDHPRS
jgi:hypothetical protein